MLAPLGLSVAGFIGSLLLASLSSGYKVENLIGYAAFGAAGCLLGYAVQSRWPGAIHNGGRWVWAPLFLLLLWAVVDTWVRFSWREAKPMLWPGPDGEEAWGLLFLTLPAFGSCLYSAGVLAAAHHRIEQGRDSMPQSLD